MFGDFIRFSLVCGLEFTFKILQKALPFELGDCVWFVVEDNVAFVIVVWPRLDNHEVSWAQPESS